MEKILLVINAVNPGIPALDFACHVAGLTNSKITGIFLENPEAYEINVPEKEYDSKYLDPKTSVICRYRQSMIEKNIYSFKDTCQSKSVRYTIHRNKGIPLPEIIRESRYADLIIVSSATSFHESYEELPSAFVKDLLRSAECPVIVAPANFEAIDEILFACNNNSSSAYAIRQFTYLFPELHEKRAILLQVNKEGEWPGQEQYDLTEWLQNHYSAIGFDALKGTAEDKLFDYLGKRKNVFIVMGAYGRSALSNFFTPSHADVLIKSINQPIFIAHL